MTAKPRPTRILFTLLAPVFLAGCAMPVPVTIASFVLDGLSMATTNKTVTDHGISFVAQQDCAVWRGFTEGELCREDGVDSDVITALKEEGETVDEDVDTNALANMETAAGFEDATEEVAELGGTPSRTPPSLSPTKVEAVPLPPLKDQRGTPAEVDAAWYAPGKIDLGGATTPQALPPLPPQAPEVPDSLDLDNETLVAPEETEETRVAREPATTPPLPATVTVEKPKLTAKDRPVEPAPAPARGPARKAKPNSGGFHYVIASFAKTGYAERLIKKNGKLGARVAEATVGTKTYYRVVVGPLAPNERRTTRRTLARAGFDDAWGVRIHEPAVEVASLD